MINRTLILTYALMVLITLLGLSAVKALNISYPIEVTSASATDLSVVGEGKVDVRPDLASLDAGIVVANAATAQEAQNQINSVHDAIVAELKKHGVEERDIRTTNYSVTPNQDYNPGGLGRISGYIGNATVTIKVRKVDAISDIVNATTQAGANQVFNITYSVENPDKYREEARNEAIANAKKQAENLAKTLGIKLGKITNISESSQGEGPGTPLFRGDMGAGGGAGLNAQPGTQTITSVVTLYFEKR